MVCGRNVLWPHRSVDETYRKRTDGVIIRPNNFVISDPSGLI